MRRNRGLLLFGINLLLALSLFFLADPFHLFQGGYREAPPLLDLDRSSVERIEILYPGWSSPLLLSQQSFPASPSSEGSDSMRNKSGESKVWTLRLPPERAGREGHEWRADRKRLQSLFSRLAEARRYYSLPVTPARLEEYSLRQQEGDSLRVRFVTKEGERVLIVGRSRMQYDDSYVRVEGEREIYHVSVNLRSLFGEGEQSYFRNRDVIPEFLRTESVRSLRFHPGGPGGVEMELSRAGGEWTMLSPRPGPTRKGSVERLLSELFSLRARSFPEEGSRGLDRSFAAMLEILYDRNLTEGGRFFLSLVGKTDYDTYFIRAGEGPLMEVYSPFLDSLFSPASLLPEQRETPPPP